MQSVTDVVGAAQTIVQALGPLFIGLTVGVAILYLLEKAAHLRTLNETFRAIERSERAEKRKRSEEEPGLDALLEEKPKRQEYTLGDDGEITPCYSSNEEKD